MKINKIILMDRISRGILAWRLAKRTGAGLVHRPE